MVVQTDWTGAGGHAWKGWAWTKRVEAKGRWVGLVVPRSMGKPGVFPNWGLSPSELVCQHWGAGAPGGWDARDCRMIVTGVFLFLFS